MTKDERTLELVLRAVARLKNLPPPIGVEDPAAIKKYYAIFDGAARWKAGVRTPQEATAPAKRPKLNFKARARGVPLAATQMS